MGQSISISALLKDENKNFIDAASKKGFSFDEIKIFLKENYDIDCIELNDDIIEQKAVDSLNHEIVGKYNIFPIKIVKNRLYLAMENPLNMEYIDSISLFTGFDIVPMLCERESIKQFLNSYYISSRINFITSQFIIDENIKKKSYSLDSDFEQDVRSAPTVKLIDSFIESAIILEASDIHIEPFKKTIRIRFRIDGHLKEFKSVDNIILKSLISRLKIMGEMDISEKRIPQDGHFKIDNGLIKIDFRISTAPTIYGEKAVIRLIYSNEKSIDKHTLGFFPEDLEKISNILKTPFGAVLVTGPTGSGKTTTLYSFLKELNKENKNIITIEDPVENFVYGINQININTKAGLGFSNILRSILRQDPDIIMVGEIRDKETASIAIRASITGHLVLSTLHTGDSANSIIRLTDMGIENYIVSSAIKCIISQRLVRCLCKNCKTKGNISLETAKILKLSEMVAVYKPVGCDKCNYTGYKGRTVVYEILTMDLDIIKLIEKKVSADEIKNLAYQKGFSSIIDCASKKLLQGITSEEEVINIVFSY